MKLVVDTMLTAEINLTPSYKLIYNKYIEIHV